MSCPTTPPCSTAQHIHPSHEDTMMKMANSSVTYAHAHTTSNVRALPKTTSDARRSCLSILGNPTHFRSFTGNIFNSKPPNSRLAIGAFSDVVSKSTPPTVPQSEQHAEWAIIVYTPPSEFFPAIAPNCTETIVDDEKPLVDLVLPILHEWTFKAPSYVVPWPLSVTMLTQEVQSCPIPNKLQIIVYAPTLCLVVAPLNLEVPCNHTVIATNAPDPKCLVMGPLNLELPCKESVIATNASECVLTDPPSSSDVSPLSSCGGAAGPEGEVDVDMSQPPSQFHFEVRSDFSCASAEGGGDWAGAHASRDSSAPGYSCLSDEPSANDLNMQSSCSEGGQCVPPAPRIMASTVPSSHARSIEMRSENRPRTFAEVISGGIATRVAVAAVNPAISAHVATVPSSHARSIEMRSEKRPRTFAEVISGGIATRVAVAAVNPAISAHVATVPSSHARSIEMRSEKRPRTFAEVISGGIATRVAVAAVNPAMSAHAATVPSSHARSVETRPENRPRTFAEVVSGGIATHVALTAVDAAKGAHTARVAQGGRALGAAAAAVALMSGHSATTRPRSWADVVKAVPM
ncbi:hypothetical protein FOA52_009716 [Chlamydomonas sp. UWO 241]|nr:hypothetical protein FOA52_009716 [Chlamydomonas sp. UWO 241]